MRRIQPLLAAALAVAGLAGCATDVEPVNPYDPAAATQQPGSVIGSAVLSDATPAAGAAIELEGPGLSTTADADGKFRFEGVVPTAPGASYAVTLSVEVGGLAYGPVRREGVVVPIGEVVDLGATVLPLSTGAVVGTVSAAGQPVSGAVVTVEGTAVAALSLADGRFALTGAPVGRRRVSASADGFRFTAVEVEIPARGAASAELAGARFDGSASLVPQAGAAPGFTRQRAVLVSASAEGAATIRASEDPSFQDPAAGDVALRPLVDPLAVELPEGEDGARLLHVQLADTSAQRSAPIPVPLFLDRVAPGIPTGSLPSTSADPELLLELELPDAAPSSGIGARLVVVDQGAQLELPAGEPLEVGALPEGLRLLAIAAVDRAGNEGPPLATGIVLDRTAPELLGVATLVDDLPGSAGAGFVRAREARLLLELADDGRLALEETGCLGAERCRPAFEVEVLRAGSAGDRFSLLPDVAGTIRVPVRLDATDGASGEVELAIADPAGNLLQLTVPYTLDETPPRIRGLQLAGGAPYTSALSVPLSVTTDADATGLHFLVQDAGPCLPAQLEAIPLEPLAGATVDLGATEGARIVCVQVADAAGNLSEIAVATVIADRTAPVPLAAAALQALVGVDLPTVVDGLLAEKGQAARAAGVTAEPIVAAWVAATDASPLTVALVAVDAGVVASFAGVPAASLSAGLPQRAVLVLPPGDGPKELHAELRDAAGNVAALPLAGSLTLILDRLPPNAPWIQPVSGVVDAAPSAALAGIYADVTLSFTALDDANGEQLELYGAQGVLAVPPPASWAVVNAELLWRDVQPLLVPSGAGCGANRCLGVAVKGNRTTRVFLRSRDLAGNLSAESLVEIVEDSAGPAVPLGLELTAGAGRVLATWAPPLAGAGVVGAQAGEVAGYEVWYGTDVGPNASALQLAGAVAAEGPSPLSTLAGQLQLTGVPDGAPLAVAVRAFDRYAAVHPDLSGHFCPADREAPVGFDPAAAHCSPFTPVLRAWPGQVTPKLLATSALAGSLVDVATAGGYAWAIGPRPGAPQLSSWDLARPTAPVLVGSAPLPGTAWMIRRHGPLACVALGSAGVQLWSLADPRAPALLSTVSTLVDARGCDLSRGRLAVAYVGDELQPPCDPLRRGGVVLYDVGNPAAPVELDRFGDAESALLRAPLDVLLVGDHLYAGSSNPAPGACSYADGDLVRVDLATRAVDFSDIAEGAPVPRIASDGTYVAAPRSGFTPIYRQGPLPYSWPTGALTGTPRAPNAPLSAVRGLAFLGSHLYAADSGLGALVIVDPATADLVGRVEIPGPQGIAGEGALGVVAGDSGLSVLQLASPGAVRVTRTEMDAGGGIALSGSLGIAGRGDNLASYDVSSGLEHLTDYPLPASREGNFLVGCAPFSTGLTRDRLLVGCQGGTVRVFAREGRSYGALLQEVVLPGSSEVPVRLVVDGDRVYVTAYSATESSLHVLELGSGGLVHRGRLLLGSGEPFLDLAIQGSTVAIGYQGQGLRVVDVSVPAAPVLVVQQVAVPFAGGVTLGGSVLYVSVVDPAANVLSFDATDRSRLVPLGASTPAVPMSASAHVGSVRWSAGMLFATLYYQDGVLFDATDPSAPTLAGGIVDQLPFAALDVIFSDTFLLLGIDYGVSRLELE